MSLGHGAGLVTLSHGRDKFHRRHIQPFVKNLFFLALNHHLMTYITVVHIADLHVEEVSQAA